MRRGKNGDVAVIVFPLIVGRRGTTTSRLSCSGRRACGEGRSGILPTPLPSALVVGSVSAVVGNTGDSDDPSRFQSLWRHPLSSGAIRQGTSVMASSSLSYIS